MKKKPFTPNTIEKVRIAAAFKCCVCRERPCFQTHHLNPNKGNDFDNAAPLCKICHDLYGPDPQKQKFIRQARDNWYKFNQDTHSIRKREIELNKEILEKLEALEAKTTSKEEFLRELVPRIVDTLHSIENDVKKYAEKGDYNGLSQSLLSLGSSATLSSGQIYLIGTTDEEKKDQIGSRWPIICPIICPHCFTSFYDQRINIGSVCPNCGKVI